VTPIAGPLSLFQALHAARDNLDVSLALRALSAAQADILAADRAPLPVLSAKASQMDLQKGIGAGNPLTQKRIDKAVGLDWTWERGDKRALRTRVAQRSAAAAQADVDDVRSQQLLATWAAYFDLLAAQDRVTQVVAIAHSAAQLAATANRRVAAGDLSAQEAARTEIEAQRAQSDVILAQVDKQRAAVALTQWMYQPSQAVNPAALQALPDWPALTPATSAADLTNSLLGILVEQRADMRAALERVQAAQAFLDNASALKKSDITVGSSFDHFPGTSNRLLEVRMQMPLQWGYSYEGEIGRAQAQLTQAQDALEKVRLLAVTEMQRLQQELQGAALRTQTFEADILPRARRVADGAELAYSKGAIPLTDLLDARRTLRATLLDALAAKTDHAKALGAWQLRTDPQSLPGRLASSAP
jgi:cobalt-zinc-cadmium efflux system outer membrane protein